MMMHCADCDGRFDRDLGIVNAESDVSEYFGERLTITAYVLSCPYCNGFELETVQKEAEE